MSIVYYPNRPYKGRVPAIDRVMAKRQPLTVHGSKDITATPLAATITSNDNWMVDSIGFTFSGATVRNFSASIVNGRNVLTNLNDYMWVDVVGAGKRLVTLTAGFYTGTQLATQLQTQLDAAYTGTGFTFTVAYAAATGLYTITPSSSTMAYIDKNTQRDFMTRDSICGHLFGLTATSAYGATVVTDTAVYGLDTEVAILSQTGSTVTSYYHNTIHVLTMDQAIQLDSNTAGVTIDYYVNYEVIV